MATLSVKIDPSQASQGARTIRKEIDWVTDAAVVMEKAVDKAAASTGKLGGGSALGGARNVKRSIDDIAKASEGAGRNVTRFTGAANDNFAKLNRQVAGVTSTFRTLASVLGPLAALFSVNALVQYADAWSDMQSRVGAAVKNMEAAPRLMQRMVDIANASYAPLSQTVEVYSRNVAVLRDLGIGAKGAADFTEALNHALVLTATRGQQAESVQNALSKAMAVGKLQAEGLQTVLAYGGEVAQALADELGVAQNDLYKLAAEGKITGDVIANALIKRLDDLRERADKMPPTIADAFMRIGTNLTALIGQMDQATGTSAAIADVLITIADNLDRVAVYAGTAAAAFGTYYVAAFVAANAATLTLAGSLAFLRGALMRTGIGLLIVGAGELVYQFTRLVEATGGFTAAFAELGRRSVHIQDAIEFGFLALTEAMASAWHSAMAEILRSTEETFGPILRAFGISAESMTTAIDRALKRAEQWRMASESSAFIASESLKLAFEGIEVAAEEAGEAIEKGGAAAEVASAEFQKLTHTVQRRLEQLQLEIGLVGKAGIEADALRFKHDLLAQAKEKSIQLGPKELQQVDELTEAYRRLATELAALQAIEDLQFERSLIGLSRGDQEIITALRRIGIAHDSEVGQMIAGQMRYNQVLEETQAELEEMHDLGKDAFMSILDLLYETGDIGEKLIGIFAGIGKQFAKMGMERLWKSLTGGGGSIFDGISGSAKGSFSPVQAAQVGREIGNSIAPAISTSLNDNLQSYAAAIRKIESGSYEGNYGALGPVVGKGSYAGDRAYGAYQVMGKNIGAWTKEVTGTAMSVQQFLNDRSAQDKVFFSKFGQSLDKFGNFADATSVWFSGRPLNRAGNSSDGYNTVPQYVSKAEDALQNYPGIRTGVRDGTIDAAKRLQSPASGAVAAESAPGIFQGENFKNLMGVGAAGLGAFFGGMQSGDPLSGGLSGLMTGIGAGPMVSGLLGVGSMAGAVIGGIGGAILGVIGALIGRSRRKKQELKQAQQELEQQMGAITQLIRSATGNFMGQYEQSLMETSDEFAKAIAMATKAKNNKLANELRQAQEEFFERTAENWVRSFEGMIGSLRSGMGFDGEFMAGMDAVEKMRESLVGFVNDAKMFAESGGDLSAYVGAARGNKSVAGIFNPGGYLNPYQEEVLVSDPGGGYQEFKKNEFIDGYLDIANQMFELGIQVFNKDGGQLYESLDELKRVAIDAGLEIDEFNRVTKQLPQIVADAVAQAQEAAIASALASLRGAESFTEMEEAVQKLQGAAAALPSLLEDLGMSAEEAAVAIEESLLVAMDKLQRTLRDDLTRSINDLAGSGFLNELWDAQATFQTRLRDLEALGMPTGLAFQELGLRVRQIAGDAELTSDQLMQLAGVFPEIGAAILGAMGVGNTASAVSDAKAKLDEARAKLRQAYDEEKSSIDRVIARMQSLQKSLRQFLDDLRLDSNLSPLDPFQRLQEAQRQFQDVAGKALAGDEEALAKLEGVSRDYLTEAKAYYASSTAYFSIFEEVETILDQALSVAGNQLSEAEQQLAALNAQTSHLLGINDGVTSVADAIAALHQAEAEHAAAQLAHESYQAQLFEQMIAIMAEMRAGGGAFDAARYIQGNPDIATAIGQGYDAGTGSADIGVIADAHWRDHGRFENREVGLRPQTRGEKYLANNPDVLAGILAGQKFGSSSDNLDEIAKAHWDLHGRFENRLHGYRQGGFTGFGGLNQVAGLVHGQEFVMHAEATRRWRPQFEAMNAGVNPFAGDSAALVSEVRGLRSEVASLKGELERNTAVTAAGAQGQIAAADGTTRAVDKSVEKVWSKSKGWAA